MVASTQELEHRDDANEAMIGELPVGATQAHIDKAIRKMYQPAEGFPDHLQPADDWDERLPRVVNEIRAEMQSKA